MANPSETARITVDNEEKGKNEKTEEDDVGTLMESLSISKLDVENFQLKDFLQLQTLGTYIHKTKLLAHFPKVLELSVEYI